MMDVVVAASLSTDLVVRVARLPAPRGQLARRELLHEPGGKGAY